MLLLTYILVASYPVPAPSLLLLDGLAQEIVSSGDDAASSRRLRSSTRSRRGRYESDHSSHSRGSGQRYSPEKDSVGDRSSEGSPDHPRARSHGRPRWRRNRKGGRTRKRSCPVLAQRVVNAILRQAPRRAIRRALRLRQRASAMAHPEAGTPATAS